MRGHLTPDEFVQALEAPPRQSEHASADRSGWRAHLRECAECSAELRELAGMAGDVASVEVPEPSPLFWEHFSRRVSAAVRQEDVGRGAGAAWRSRLRQTWRATAVGWRVAVPAMSAAAVVVLLVWMWRPAQRVVPQPAGRSATVTSERPLAQATDDDPSIPPGAAGEEEAWQVFSALAAETDDPAAPVTGEAPGEADRAIQQLSAEERDELGRLLKAELGLQGRLEG